MPVFLTLASSILGGTVFSAACELSNRADVNCMDKGGGAAFVIGLLGILIMVVLDR